MRGEETRKKASVAKTIIKVASIIVTFILGFSIAIWGMQGTNKSTNNENRTEQTSTDKKAKKQSSTTKKGQDTNISVTIQSPDTSKGKKAESEQKPDTRKQDAGEMDEYYRKYHLNPQPEDDPMISDDDPNWEGSHYSDEEANEKEPRREIEYNGDDDEMNSESTYSISTETTDTIETKHGNNE
jgi:hypothetical protein